MSLDSESLTIEEVERALSEIENKYSPIKSSKRKDSFEEALVVLSKEFDSIGLPTVDLSQPVTKIFKQVVSSARSLVHIHRRTLSQMKDVNIESKYKDTKSIELYKVIDDYKLSLSKCEEQKSLWQNKLAKLKEDHKAMLKRESDLKEELEKNRRYYLSKQNDLQRHIKKLTKENQHLREVLGKDINVHHSKDEVTLELMRKYKTNEEIFKATIQQLQENNKELLNEICDLKVEHRLAVCDKQVGSS